MTIKELIEILEEYPPETVVRVADWSEAYNPPTELTTVTARDNEIILEDN